jgi:hypothetical protein
MILQCEPDGFASFHLYVCAAFLTRFSQQLLRERDFQVKAFQLFSSIYCSIDVCAKENFAMVV